MFSSTEMAIVAMVIMLVFGSSQIPKLAKNLGIAQRELKNALAGDDDDDEVADKGTLAPVAVTQLTTKDA